MNYINDALGTFHTPRYDLFNRAFDGGRRWFIIKIAQRGRMGHEKRFKVSVIEPLIQRTPSVVCDCAIRQFRFVVFLDSHISHVVEQSLSMCHP